MAEPLPIPSQQRHARILGQVQRPLRGVRLPRVHKSRASVEPVAYRVLRPDDVGWLTRPHEPGEPARHVAELSEAGDLRHVRANIWRYEPGAAGRRHRHPTQDETFVVLE